MCLRGLLGAALSALSRTVPWPIGIYSLSAGHCRMSTDAALLTIRQAEPALVSGPAKRKAMSWRSVHRP